MVGTTIHTKCSTLCGAAVFGCVPWALAAVIELSMVTVVSRIFILISSFQLSGFCGWRQTAHVDDKTDNIVETGAVFEV